MLFEVVSILLTIPGLSQCDQLLGVQCEADPLGYVVPDPAFCDRYLECSPGGQGSIQLCPPGHGLDLNTGICLPLDKINCDTRGSTYRTTKGPIVPKFFKPRTTTQVPQQKSTTITSTSTTTQATAGFPKSPSSKLFGSSGSVRDRNTAPTSQPIVNELSEGSRKLSVNLNSRGSLITSDPPVTVSSEPFLGIHENLESLTKSGNHFFGGRNRASSIPSIAPATAASTSPEPSFSILGSSRDPSPQTQSREFAMDIEKPTEESTRPFTIFGSSRVPHPQLASDAKVNKLSEGSFRNPSPLTESSREFEMDIEKPTEESTRPFTIFGSSRVSNPQLASDAKVNELSDGSFRNPSSQTQSSREFEMDIEKPAEESTRPVSIFGSSRVSHLQLAPDTQVKKHSDGSISLKAKIFGSSRSEPTHSNIDTEAEKPSDESKSRPRISIFGSPRGSNVVDKATKTESVPRNSKLASSVASKLLKKSKKQRTNIHGSRRRGFGILSPTSAPSRTTYAPRRTTSTAPSRMTSTGPQSGKFVIVDGFVVGVAPTTKTPLINKNATATTKKDSPPSHSRSVHIPSTTVSYRLEEHDCNGVDDYIVPDQEYCDRYLSCPSSKVVLCLTNMVLDINTGVCREKAAVDCTGRELLYRNVNQEDEENKKFEEEMKQIMAPFQPSQHVPDENVSNVDSQSTRACVVSRGEYVMADPVYCDRYMTCPEGEMEMCQRGMVLDLVTQLCMVREKVDCKGRERIYREEERSMKSKVTKNTVDGLNIPFDIHTDKETIPNPREGTEDEHMKSEQEKMSNFVLKTPTKTKTFASHGLSTTMTPISPLSESRLNPADSLPRKVKMMVDLQQIKLVDHLPRKSLEGIIVKTPLGPRPTVREELDILLTTTESPLPLSDSCGGQDRMPHPSDCKLFFTCSARGRKTLGSCDKPHVFNSVTGVCDAQENVPGCEGYYNNHVFKLDTVGREKIVEEIREQLIKEFGLERV